MAYVGRQPLAGEVIVLDDIQSQFNGVLTSFTLQRSIGGISQSFFPVTTAQLLVSLGGTIQEPDRGGTRGFKIDGNQIVFATAPPTGTDSFIVSYGNVTDLVDYSELTGFKSTVENDNIYYVNDLSILTTQNVGNTQSNTFFTLAPTVTVNNSVDFTVNDGESLSIEALAGGGGSGSSYVLPTASTTTLGGVRIDGTTISISGGTISALQNTDYNNLTNTPDITFLSRVNDASRTTNDLLVYDGTNWVDSTTVTGLTLTNCSGTIRGTSTDPGTHFNHDYVDGTTENLKIAGAEAVIDIVGTEDGSHAASVVLRGQNNGGTITYNPDQSELRFGTFTATANDFTTHDTEDVRLKILRSNGNVLPGGDNTQDLGSSTARWANIYSADLQLSNEGSVNDVDGTWGKYTIQEGEDDLFLINRRNGKTYKFNLTEVA